MKQFRLSTLMLVIVIAALCVALFVMHNRATRREAELQAQLAKPNQAFWKSSMKRQWRPAPAVQKK